MDRERAEADVREARDYLERGLIVPNAVVRAIDHCEQLLAALAEAEQQLATLRLGGVPNRMLDAVAKERDEARAALAALEAEVDGPSGLREQLGAARKGTQIEKRMRDRLEAENERLREQRARLAMFAQDDSAHFDMGGWETPARTIKHAISQLRVECEQLRERLRLWESSGRLPTDAEVEYFRHLEGLASRRGEESR